MLPEIGEETSGAGFMELAPIDSISFAPAALQ
jgi:hypothetical protein